MKRGLARTLGTVLAAAVVAAGCSGGGGGGQDIDALLGESTQPGERPIQFAGAGGLQLSGTLTVPPAAAGAAKLPAVLFVPTLGPGDRDGPVVTGGVPDRIYLDLSKELVGKGYATFRYDRRGRGLSRMRDEASVVTFDDVVADARAGMDFLAERAEVDATRISVVAYDKGGLVALRLAAADRRVARMVLLSTPGRPLVDVLADEVTPAHGSAVAARLREVVGGLTARSTLPPLDTMPAPLRLYFVDDEPAFLAKLFAVNPTADAAKVDAPTLLVVSGVVPGVSKVDADRLAAAIGPEAQVFVTPTAGRTLQTETRTTIFDRTDSAAGTGHEHDASAIPSPLAAREQPVVDRIVGFLGTGRQ